MYRINTKLSSRVSLSRVKNGRTFIFLFILLMTSQSYAKGDKSEYLVREGETLWSIAEGMESKDISVWQVMDGIYKSNKFSFEKNDPTQIIEGIRLLIPEVSFLKKQDGLFVANLSEIEKYSVSDNDDGFSEFFDSSTESIKEHDENIQIPYFIANDPIADASQVDPGSTKLSLVSEALSKNEAEIKQLNTELKLIKEELAKKTIVIKKFETEKKVESDKTSIEKWLIYGESKMLLSLILLVIILYFLRRLSYFKTITTAQVNGRSSNSKDLSKQESLENEFEEIDALEIKMTLIRSLIDDNEDDAAKEVLKELISESVGKDKETAQAMLKDLEKS